MDPSATREEVAGVCRTIARAFGPDGAGKPLDTVSEDSGGRKKLFQGLGDRWKDIFGDKK